MTWFQFKKYWSDKNPGGWHYTDCLASKNVNKDLFEKAWTIAGPIYCQKYGLDFVPYNKVEYQRNVGNAANNVHFIFALDSSGSMSNKWGGVIQVLKETLRKMIEIYQGTNKAMVSLMGFDNNVYPTFENIQP